MSKREKLSDEAIEAFLKAHEGWAQEASDGAIAGLQKTFPFKDYGAGIAFVVRLAIAAEKRDHHPDLHVLWGKVRVHWSTHDAGGVTALDTEMAEAADRLHASGG